MLLTQSFSSVVVWACIAWIFYGLLQYILDPLRHIPGPFLARFTRLWYFYKICQGNFERTNIDLHRAYGPIVRIAPNQYSIDDFAAAKTIYGHGNKFLKAPWYWAWMPPNPQQASLFADLDPHHHAAQRRKVASAYSMSSLVGYEPFVNNCSTLLLSHFEKAARYERSIDIAHWFQCYAFDVVGEITFGRRFGVLDEGLDKDNIFNAIHTRTCYSTLIGIFPALHRFLFPLLPSSGGHGYVSRYTKSQITLREESYLTASKTVSNETPDFVSKFLAIIALDPVKMTTMDIFTTCQSNIGAGSDTTAITLTAVMYYLLRSPRSLERLQVEIDNGRREGTISRPVTFKEASQLPYLQAVIKESLRVHPATGLPLARKVPIAGAELAGVQFSSGSVVGINSWVAHRNPSVYGSDVDEWRPERWLEIEQQGRGAEVEKYFFAFGMGSRTCIGKNLGLLEVSKLIPELLSRFTFELDESIQKNGWKTSSMWFVKPSSLNVRVARRY